MTPDRVQETRGRIVTETDVLIQGYSIHLRDVLRKSENTVKTYVAHVHRWMQWWGRPPEFFKEEEWDDWTAWMSQKGLTAASINHYRVGVKRFFKYLRRRKIVSHDPSSLNERMQPERKLPTWLLEDEVDRIIAAAENTRDRAMLEILYSCGLRSTECRTLTLASVQGELLQVTGKGKKERIVAIPSRAKAALDAWLKERPADTPYLFPSAQRREMEITTLYKLVKRLAKAAGIVKDVHPHTFRHSIATHLAMRGVHPDRIQLFLGHESIETTMIYIHLADSLVQEAVLAAHPHGQVQPQ